MKKLRNPIIYVLVMALFLAGCSGSGVVGDQVKKQRNIRIGVSMNDVYDTFIVELSARLNECRCDWLILAVKFDFDWNKCNYGC